MLIDRELCVKCGSCARSCSMGVIRMGENGPEINPKRRCIRCMHCAAACPGQAVVFEDIPREKLYINAPDNELQRIIASRRSIRHFKPELPPRELIRWALDMSSYAPSGKNVHDNRFSVIWGREQAQQVTDMVLNWCGENNNSTELIKLAERGTDLLMCHAPCVIVGWCPEDSLNPCVDTAIAMETVELLLFSKGLATCWGGYLSRISNSFPELKKLLGVPEGSRVYCSLMAGYADRESYPNIPYRPGVEVNWLE